MKKKLAQLKLAMELDARGEWDKAHEIVQTINNELSYRIHAYLHRKEGNRENANYWYRRLAIEPFHGDFATEKNDIMRRLEKM